MNLPSATVVSGEGELSALLAAILLSPVLPILHIAFLRLCRKAGGSLVLVLAFSGYAALWFLVGECLHRGAWPNAGELLAGCSFMLAALVAYVEFFSVVCRSFSLRILVDIRANGALSPDEIHRNYAGGRGLDWLLEKRINGLVSLGLIRRHGDILEIAPVWGRIAGQLGLAAKLVLKIGKGG